MIAFPAGNNTNMDYSNIPEIIKRIVTTRNTGCGDIEEFLSPKPTLVYDPFLLSNMREGVDVLLRAVDRGKRIVIYGDYDVDGITSTALLMKVLGSLTDNLTYYIPSRIEEGYGLHMEAIERIHSEGGEFIVTVDCGSVSRKETEYAHSLGLETLVTDHHNVSGVRAEGLVINPRLEEDEYPFKGLAGVGVAYKLALAISRVRPIPKPVMAEILELATIGTIADIMPLLDENRTLVKCGLRSIHLGCRNRGLRKLIDMSNLEYASIRASDISFGIAPKINASGRMGTAATGVELFLAEDNVTAQKCCRLLIEANLERRRLQDDAYSKGLEMVEAELAAGDFVIVEINDSHEGVLGIVAGKLREKVNRPVIIVSRNGDIFKGTGRSVPGVDLFAMLDKYRDEFISFGGHSAACGFTIAEDKLMRLKSALNADIAELQRENVRLLDVRYECDAVLEPGDVTIELAEAAALLEPCGKDNEVPAFALKNVQLSGWRYLKNDTKMAKFTVLSDTCESFDCLLFHDAAEVYEEISDSMRADIIGYTEINTWKKTKRVQLIAQHVMPAGKADEILNCRTEM